MDLLNIVNCWLVLISYNLFHNKTFFWREGLRKCDFRFFFTLFVFNNKNFLFRYRKMLSAQQPKKTIEELKMAATGCKIRKLKQFWIPFFAICLQKSSFKLQYFSDISFPSVVFLIIKSFRYFFEPTFQHPSQI
jgi:hypothetical protein